MSVVKEFRDFAMRGNVVDLAVGVVIGGAFGKIVSSLVSDVIMPPIGLALGGVNFTDIKVTLKDAILDATGAVTAPAVTLNIGSFIQTVFDFTIIAFAIFMIVILMNAAKKIEEAAPAPPPTPTKEEVLLTEIRDLLKK